MSRPRIVHMVEAFEKVGGPPRLVRLITASPLRDKYDFHVLSYDVSGSDFKAVGGLRRRLVELRPDCVHVHGLKSDGFLAALAATLAGTSPIIVTVHGSTQDAVADYRGFKPRLRKWVVGRLLEPATLAMADAVYCVCEAMSHQPRIRRHAGGRLRETIHNGVRILPLGAASSRLRGQFGFTPDDVVVLYAGRIALDKGLAVLAKAVGLIFDRSGARVQDRARKLKFLVVGDGPAFAEVRRSFEKEIQAGQVVMAGRRNDIEQLNSMADIFVLPSFRENLPFSILEAMNAGRPVVATRAGGIPELVADGKTGLLVPPGDVEALAAALGRLASDGELRREMGQAGHEVVARHFSAEAVIHKTAAMYESVLPAKDEDEASAPVRQSAPGVCPWAASAEVALERKI